MSSEGPIFGGGLFGGGSNKTLFGDKRRASGEVEVVDLNLTPLMDVMSNILFFLLATFGAAIVSFLAASVPVEAEEGTTPPEPRTDQVVLSLGVGPEGYKLRLNNDKIPREKLDALGGVIPRTPARALDRGALAKRLLEVKTAYPGSDTILIAPDQAVTYEEIVGTMEAARDTQVEGKRLRMFPKAVIAETVKADAVPSRVEE